MGGASLGFITLTGLVGCGDSDSTASFGSLGKGKDAGPGSGGNVIGSGTGGSQNGGAKSTGGAAASSGTGGRGGATVLDGSAGNGGAVSCVNSRDCAAVSGRHICDRAIGECVACVVSADCTRPNVCVNDTCVPPCTSDLQCLSLNLLCDQAAGHCVECLNDRDCDASERCMAGACRPRSIVDASTDAPGSGGVTGSGGTSSGGTDGGGSGGASTNGGAGGTGTGGASSGGAGGTGTGGASTGGAGTGGVLATGGAPTGGSPGTGGRGNGGAGGSTGGASATGGSATGGSSTDGGTEDCFNGLDDDGDGDIDCADTDCTEAACVPQAPPNWIGPVSLYEGVGTNPVPACALPFPFETLAGGVGVHGDPAVCSTCTCGKPTVDCNTFKVIPETTLFTGTCRQCSQNVATATSTCSSLSPGCTAGDSNLLLAESAICTPSKQTPTVPPVKWDTAARVCAAPSLPTNSCSLGNVCAPKPEAPFAGKLCISRDGDVACPSGPYTDRHLEYGGITDTRACSPCFCGEESGGCTGAVALAYGGPSCSAQTATTLPLGVCTAFTPGFANSVILKTAGTPTGSGSCPPSSSTAGGSVTQATPTTVCCLP